MFSQLYIILTIDSQNLDRLNRRLQYECTLPQAFNKITHIAIALENIHAFTRDQGGDIFELPPFSVDLTPIDTDCSIVKRHVSRMSNKKGKHF